MLLASILFMSTFAVTTEQLESSNEPLAMMEEYFVNQRYLTLDHPRMRDLRERIKDETDSHFQFDLSEVQKRLERLMSDRTTLMETKGLTHPDVVADAVRLSLMSLILTGQSAAALRDISETRK